MQRKTSHLGTLDALRRVAALAVFMCHLGFFRNSKNFIPRGYLAVDFFFLLSGFVIARAYETSLQLDDAIFLFLKRRLIRLYPLILLSMIIGFATAASKVFLGHSASAAPLIKLLVKLAFGLSMTPWLSGNSGQIFTLNAPAWSLFFELLINFAYAFAARFLTMGRLAAFVVMSGFCYVACVLYCGNGDEGVAPSGFFGGIIRVSFSFSLGVCLYRLYDRKLFDRLPTVSGLFLAPLLILCFLPSNRMLGGWYDPLCVFFIFPAIVVAGCFDKLPRKLRPFSLLLGNLSYPIYILHWPAVQRNSYHLLHGRHGVTLLAGYALDTSAICVIAWIALKFSDEPVRAFLTQRFTTTKKGGTPKGGPVLLPVLS